MESPATICTSAWSEFSRDGESGLLLSASDSLLDCNNSWQYIMESVDSDVCGAGGNTVLASSVVVNKDYNFDDCYNGTFNDDDNNDPFNKVVKRYEKISNRSFNGSSTTNINNNSNTEQPIEPPLEFQDVPGHGGLEQLAKGIVNQIVGEALSRSVKDCMPRLCYTPEPLSSSRRPASRSSLNSRLSSSHNSLSVPTANKADDSSFITSAMSHDVLDMYNVPLDSDIYTLPVDSLKSSNHHRLKRQHKHHRKRKRDTTDVSSHGVVTSTDGVPSSIELISNSPICLHHQTPIIDNSTPFLDNKRYSLPSTSMSRYIDRAHCAEPIHMTLQEVRQFLHNIYSSTSTIDLPEGNCIRNTVESSKTTDDIQDVIRTKTAINIDNPVPQLVGCKNSNNGLDDGSNKKLYSVYNNYHKRHYNKNMFSINVKNRKSKLFSNKSDVNSLNNNNDINKNNYNINDSSRSGDHNCEDVNTKPSVIASNVGDMIRKSDASVTSDNHVDHGDRSFGINIRNRSHGSGCTKNSFSYTLKQTLCNIFRFARRSQAPSHCHHSVTDTVLVLGVSSRVGKVGPPPFIKRALPPLPSHNKYKDCLINRDEENVNDEETLKSVEEGNVVDFASSIEKVKDYGWYWGPISGETAEKILSNEPDGSFIVRDSSDDHYIFSLTFKLNSVVRHVRIEHDQGNFSFGSCTKFKSHTIVDFIENAVEHSRSGRYLFFLHRRPVHGPMRVQLLHPVSRFKQVQSLQHMCRFVILKVVRRDLISSLPLPRRIIDYLSSPHYYSEHPSLPPDDNQPSSSPSLHVFSFMPPNS